MGTSKNCHRRLGTDEVNAVIETGTSRIVRRQFRGIQRVVAIFRGPLISIVPVIAGW